MSLRQITIGSCPLCGEGIDLAAVSDSTERESPFWGEPGKRFLICREGAHFHIQVETAEGLTDRYAFMVPYSLPKRGTE